jgi:hypothetical protein
VDSACWIAWGTAGFAQAHQLMQVLHDFLACALLISISAATCWYLLQ